MSDRPAGPRRRRLLLAAAAVLVVLAGALVVTRATARDGAADTFVTRSGTTLRADGSPFRFVGFNLYDAAASDIYSCDPGDRLDDGELDDAMSRIADSGGTVVRFWAYQTYTDGGTDFSGVDRVIDAARAHGLRVLPVLEDGPGNCSTGPAGTQLSLADGATWYTGGYRTPLGSARISYRSYVAVMTHHYRDDTTIMAWSLMNEAETGQRDPSGQSVLVDFARDVAAVAHHEDPHHLVTLGTQSNGAPGASGADFADVYGLSGLDFAEVHDWGSYGSDSQAMPGAPEPGTLPAPDQCQATNAQIACSFALAEQLGKPIIVGEAGIAADDAAARQVRAQEFEPKIAAAFAAGASGYLIWQLNRTNTDTYAVTITGSDPLLAVLHDAARRWTRAGS